MAQPRRNELAPAGGAASALHGARLGAARQRRSAAQQGAEGGRRLALPVQSVGRSTALALTRRTRRSAPSAPRSSTGGGSSAAFRAWRRALRAARVGAGRRNVRRRCVVSGAGGGGGGDDGGAVAAGRGAWRGAAACFERGGAFVAGRSAATPRRNMASRAFCRFNAVSVAAARSAACKIRPRVAAGAFSPREARAAPPQRLNWPAGLVAGACLPAGSRADAASAARSLITARLVWVDPAARLRTVLRRRRRFCCSTCRWRTPRHRRPRKKRRCSPRRGRARVPTLRRAGPSIPWAPPPPPPLRPSWRGGTTWRLFARSLTSCARPRRTPCCARRSGSARSRLLTRQGSRRRWRHWLCAALR